MRLNDDDGATDNADGGGAADNEDADRSAKCDVYTSFFCMEKCKKQIFFIDVND